MSVRLKILERVDPRGRSLGSPLPHLVGALLLVALASTPAQAHHGRDFLLARTASLPHPGEVYFVPRVDYSDGGEEGETELEPTLLYGFNSWLAGEIHLHVAKEGSEDFEVESTAPAVHFRFTDPEKPWGLGLSLEYEISHLGDHPDVAEAAVILSRESEGSKLAFNIVAEEEQESGSAVTWAYSLAFRRPVTSAFDLGVEVLGDLEEPGDGEALLGIYLEPASGVTLNLGIGTSYGDAQLDLSIRTSLAIRIGR